MMMNDVPDGKVVEVVAPVVEQTRELSVYDQLREQYSMSIEEQKGLIRSESALTDKTVKLAVKVAMSFGLPLQGINVIPNKNGSALYVNADGLRWRLHTDPRGIKKSTAEITHRPTREEPWIESVATVEMGDGSQYTNYGVVECLPGPGVGNAILKAVTKAKRRAAVDAVGVALPIAEDFLEWQQEEHAKPIEGSFTIVDEKKIAEPTNLSELMAWVASSNHNIDEAVKIAGNPSEMASDIALALKKMKAEWSK